MTWQTRASIVAVCALAVVAATRSRASDSGDSPIPDAQFNRDAQRTVVVAELFTSEGCSSCPPADSLLRRLLSTQPIEGVEVVALGNHVDYWDRLGWRDPFSSRLFSERQSAYDATVFRSRGPYTPQLVVDGALECVASDERAVRTALRDATKRPKGTVSLTTGLAGGTSATLNVRWNIPAGVSRQGAADLVVAVTEDDLSTQVLRGENKGHQLVHSAVVRTLMTVAPVGVNERDAAVATAVTLDPHWNLPHVRVVGFIQEQKTRRIIAAGATSLLPPASHPRQETP